MSPLLHSSLWTSSRRCSFGLWCCSSCHQPSLSSSCRVESSCTCRGGSCSQTPCMAARRACMSRRACPDTPPILYCSTQASKQRASSQSAPLTSTTHHCTNVVGRARVAVVARIARFGPVLAHASQRIACVVHARVVASRRTGLIARRRLADATPTTALETALIPRVRIAASWTARRTICGHRRRTLTGGAGVRRARINADWACGRADANRRVLEHRSRNIAHVVDRTRIPIIACAL